MRTKTYYRVCPFCGANLDPCERCDCAGERKGSEAHGRHRKGSPKPIQTGMVRTKQGQAAGIRTPLLATKSAV